MIQNNVLDTLASFYKSITIIDNEGSKDPSSVCKELSEIYGILKIKCNKRFLIYNENDQTIIKEFDTAIKWNISYKITPYELNKYDKECVEDILNNKKYIDNIKTIEPLFNALGYNIEYNDKYLLKFIGSPTYNSPISNIDWKVGGYYDWKFDKQGYDWKKILKNN